MGKKKISSQELIIVLLVLLMSIQAIFFSDLYVPALPEIAAALHTTQSVTEISISVYFFGFAIAQCIYGPLSEQVGRRKVVLLGIVVCIVGSLSILLTSNIYIFLLGRFIQAVGMAAPMLLGRVITKDIFPENIRYARVTSFIGAGVLIAPALAPITGGYIQTLWNWRADFIFIQILILINFALVYFYLPETLPADKRIKVTFRSALSDYYSIFRNTTFLTYVICAGCTLAGMIAYVTVSPFLFEKNFHFTPLQYSWLSILTSFTLILSMLTNIKLVTVFGINKQIRNGLFLMILASILILIFLIIHYINPFTIIISVILFYFGAGFSFINAAAGSFSPFKEKIGFVGSLFNLLRLAMISLVSAAVSFSTTWPLHTLVTVFFALSTISCLMYYIQLGEARKQI